MMNPAIDFFHPNVCHVCKITSRDAELKRCSQCRTVAYCSTLHQKRNWKYHKALCQAVVKALSIKLTEDVRRHRMRRRSAVMMLCEMFLGRKLDAVEMNMVYFRKVCWYCDGEERLRDCLRCLTNSVCEKHVFDEGHEDWDCKQLRLCLDAHLFKARDYYYPTYSFRKNVTCNFIDMDSFLSKNVKINATALTSALTSDLLTRPLTLYYALKILNTPLPQHLTIHIIGSNQFETATAQHWDIIPRLLPTLKTLKLIFIGPEVPTTTTTTTIDHTNTTIIIKTSSRFYHEFAANETAHVIVAYNCGLHEFEGVDDTWGPSLRSLLARRTPIVLTSYTLSEAILDVDRLHVLDPGLRVRQYCNPFASLSPLRDVESQGVYFVNSVLSVVTFD